MSPKTEIERTLLESYLEVLKQDRVTQFTGVACSILAPLIQAIEADSEMDYLPATREDLGIGLAAGFYLSGQHKIPAILMQNSGLGYSLNALTSLNLIYKIPVLMIVGFRGETREDAPEHWVMGDVCGQLLKTINIPYWVPEKESLVDETRLAIESINKKQIPAAILLRKGILK